MYGHRYCYDMSSGKCNSCAARAAGGGSLSVTTFATAQANSYLMPADMSMVSKPEVLIWPGAESMAAITHALDEGRDVELVVSTGLHNAFISRFASDAHPKFEGQMDLRGGPELLRRLADIAGLEPLAELEQPLRERGWRVAILSPVPRILLLPPR
jgi:hypothetical protein